MNSKAIFFDIDGTLINFDGEFPESAKVALREAKKNGHKIFLCSGRSKCQIEDRLLEFGFDGYVTASGAYVEYEGKEVFSSFMTEAQLKKLISFCEENEIIYMLQCTDATVSSRFCLDAMHQGFLARMKNKKASNLEKIFASERCDDNIVANASRYFNAEKLCYHNSKKDPDQVGADLGKEFQVTSMSFSEMQKTSGEITIRGVDKALGIQKMIEYLGIDLADTVAFGDGPNDYEMMEYVATSVAMGNASDDLKSLASFVTTAISEDGIYNGMKKLGLI
ncbi:MAG: HAD family hydrolase [Pseudobutyrivibrio sp.]|nr:HAD family hydrolase [Pseudobutyrivibrio sp.]